MSRGKALAIAVAVAILFVPVVGMIWFIAIIMADLIEGVHPKGWMVLPLFAVFCGISVYRALRSHEC